MTKAMRGEFRPWRWMLAVAVCAVLAACAQTGSSSDAGKDRVTASDETDTARRSRVRLELASAYFSRGQLTTALDEVKQSIQADPRNAQAYNLRGLIYAGMADAPRAEESFKQALQLDPQEPDTMQNYGWYLCQQGRFDAADAMFAQAAAQPRYALLTRTLMTRGICQARAGKTSLAVETLSRAYEREPGNPAIAVNLAETLLRAGEYERARFYIRKVNAIPEVSSAQTLWLAARIENKLGNRQGVSQLADQMRQRFPQATETGRVQRGQFDE